jgi:hypothetical protein
MDIEAVLNRLVIGERDVTLQEILAAVDLEFSETVKPLVKNTNKNYRKNVMETYAKHVFVKCIKILGVGETLFPEDGTTADLLFRIGIEDSYMRIQVRTTARIRTATGSPHWSFVLNRPNRPGHTKHLMFFRSIEDGMMWLAPYDELPDHKNFQVTCSIDYRKKWKKYEVTREILASQVVNYYQSLASSPILTGITLAEANIPIAECHRKELEYRNLKMDRLKFLKFERPHIEYYYYDILVNGYKVQEKPLYYSSPKSLTGTVTHRTGNPYKESEMDILWLNIADKIHFYFIPVYELVRIGLLITDSCAGRGKITVYPEKEGEWSNAYYFSYNDPKIEEKLTAIMNRLAEYLGLTRRLREFLGK